MNIVTRAVVAGIGCLMILATILSFATSGKEWFDWVSALPILFLLFGMMLNKNTLEPFLDGLLPRWARTASNKGASE